REERPERLAEACARGILGGGHAGVVAAVVLDEEVAVAGGGERDLGQPLLTSRDLVAQLVPAVDADAAGDGYGPGHADRAGDPEPAVVAEPRQIVRGPQVAGDDERGGRQRAVAVWPAPVERARLAPVPHLVRRVVAAGAGREVGGRGGGVAEARQQGPRRGGRAPAAEGVEPDEDGHRAEQAGGRHEAGQPQVARG